MKFRDKLYIGSKIVTAKFFNMRLPLFVGWAVTNKCNLNCLYCGRSKIAPEGEMSADQARLVIDQLNLLGTKVISFTGGEPLLRQDLPEIINYAAAKRISVSINTNGTLFLERLKELGNLSSIRFSLDGDRDVNDYIRGKGTYEKVVNAIKSAKQIGIKPCIITVISKYNISNIGFLINLAEQLRVGIIFQPVTLTLLNSSIANPHIPDTGDYRAAIDKVISYKKMGKPVFNSLKGLQHLRSWPEGRRVFCFGRRISCRIEYNGLLYHCGRWHNYSRALNCVEKGTKLAFESLPEISCNDCWCAPQIETNFLAALKPSVIAFVVSKYRKII